MSNFLFSILDCYSNRCCILRLIFFFILVWFKWFISHYPPPLSLVLQCYIFLSVYFVDFSKILMFRTRGVSDGCYFCCTYDTLSLACVYVWECLTCYFFFCSVNSDPEVNQRESRDLILMDFSASAVTTSSCWLPGSPEFLSSQLPTAVKF